MKGIIKKLTPLFLVLAIGCTMELPEKGTEAARLYAEKCGICHRAYHPEIIPPRGWRGVIKRMEKKVKATGVREPLSEADKAVILGYLEKHGRKRGL